MCTLLASMEQPEKITLALAATILVAAVPVFVTQFHLLPYALDFVSMAAVLAPLLLGCAFIIAQPGIGLLGLLSAVYFAVASHIDNSNVMTYDVVGFLNTSLAIFIGIGVALVMFATFFPETPARAGRRFRRQLSAQLSRLAAARHPLATLSSLPFVNSLPRPSHGSKTSRAGARVLSKWSDRFVDRTRDRRPEDRNRRGPARARHRCRGLESARPHLTGLPPSVPGEPHQNRVGGPLPASPLSRHGARRVRRGANRGVDRCPRRMRGAPLLVKALILLRETSDVR